jgi:hypothetical protein
LSPAQALLDRLAELRAVVEIGDNGRLVIRAVLTAIPKEVVGSVRALKVEIMELIQASASTPASAIPVAAVSNNGITANTNREIIRRAEPKCIPTAPTVSENSGTSTQSKPDVICRTQPDCAPQKSLTAEAPVCLPSRDTTALHNRDIVAPRRLSDEWTAGDCQAFFDERVRILESDCHLPRLNAETKAFECCVVEWQNRNPVCAPPGRCVACNDVERAGVPALLPIGTKGDECAWVHSTLLGNLAQGAPSLRCSRAFDAWDFKSRRSSVS